MARLWGLHDDIALLRALFLEARKVPLDLGLTFLTCVHELLQDDELVVYVLHLGLQQRVD